MLKELLVEEEFHRIAKTRAAQAGLSLRNWTEGAIAAYRGPQNGSEPRDTGTIPKTASDPISVAQAKD